MRKLLLLIALFVLLVGCKTQEKTVDIESPYLGGTQGVVASFVELRSEVFDSGVDPFDVVVQAANKGEYEVPSTNIRIKLSGINPAEFAKTEAELIAGAPDNLLANQKLATGEVLPSPPVFVEFLGLNYLPSIAGATARFPVRAEYCYNYGTNAVSKICIRRNLLNPREGGICEVTGAKPLYNSGGPIQIQNFQEATRARDKVGFSFDLVNAGTGSVFEFNSICDRTTRQKENRVWVKVNTNLPGLTCTGLASTATGAEGFATIFGGSKKVTCTQPVTTATDFEQIVSIETLYDYEEFVQTELIVKSSGQAS